MSRVRLNVDLGELADEPEALYALAHLANVACGGHAGDDASIDRALALAALHGTQLGAHPSYPDRAGFGRSALAMPTDALMSSVDAQLARIARCAERAGARVAHVKAHGALYHAIDRDDALAEAFVATCRARLGAIEVLGSPGGATERATRTAALAFVREGFADRGLRPDGSLVPRSEPGAMIDDPARAAQQARVLAASGRYDTLCVHGDGAHALAIARAVRDALG